jgi:hypothetical protein
MNPVIPVPFRNLLKQKIEEREALLAYREERLADIVTEVGFSCNRCAKCCTRAFNGHVHLLDDDADQVSGFEPEALEPAFPFDFCDQHGTFYVSGYTIRSQQDEAGSCFFLEDGNCRIYPARPRVCRVYPYMLHREPDEKGIIDWRQISGLNVHGDYHSEISSEDAIGLARETKLFETAVLDHDIAFLEYTRDNFSRLGLRHVRKVYDDRIRAYRKGTVVKVLVYHRGRFKPWQVAAGESIPIQDEYPE